MFESLFGLELAEQLVAGPDASPLDRITGWDRIQGHPPNHAIADPRTSDTTSPTGDPAPPSSDSPGGILKENDR